MGDQGKVKIHPSAVISPRARLGSRLEVAPGVVIGDQVEIGDDCSIGPHAVITGNTVIGPECRIFTGAVVGSEPQDLKYRGEDTRLVIGARNTIREYVTINPATDTGGETRIGSDNLIMAYSHIAHNCLIGNHTILANGSTLAGHVVIEDHVILGGLSAAHQFCLLGAHAIIGGCSKITRDIPPYTMADGYPARVTGINRTGLRRRGFPSATIDALHKACRFLLTMNTTRAVERIRAEIPPGPEIENLLSFIARSERGLAISHKREWKRLA